LVRPAFFSTPLQTIGMFFHLYLTSVYLNEIILFGVQGSVNKIDKYVNFASGMAGTRGMVVSNPGDLMYYGVDASVIQLHETY
jgi:hypothetical protein